MNNPIKRFTPYTLENPVWLLAADLRKGTFHDRQALGFILPAGESINVRRSSPIDTDLILNFFNDDRRTESSVVITSQWTTFTATHPAVVFIQTPYSAITAEIEYTVTREKPLPIYTPQGNAQAFFQTWDEQDAEFALIQTTYANLLVPAFDKQKTKELHQTCGLDSLETFYTSVFEYFNSLAGISFTTTVRTDRNIPNRYFIKADKSGGGGAYYGHSWIAQVSPSIATCGLDVRPDNWCALHEIAHGYQGVFMQNTTVPSGEVWNNVYAAYYQHKMMGNEIYERGWMYGGNSERTFVELQNRLDSNTPITTWHHWERLFFFLFIFDKAGEHVISLFNQEYRRLVSKDDFKLADHPMMDVIARICATRANVDIGPFMAFVQAPLSYRLRDTNLYNNLIPAWPLYRLVPAASLRQIQQTLRLKTPLSLVDSRQLKTTDLKGSLKLTMNAQSFKESQGKVLLIKDGSNISRLQTITSPEIHLNNFPIGVYTLLHPSAPHARRIATCNHIEVQALADNPVTLEYQYYFSPSLASQRISLRGLSGEFASLEFDMQSSSLKINVISSRPHPYAHNTIYAAITVQDRNDFLLFHKDMPGIDTVISSDEIAIGSGYKVTLFHQEPTRLVSTPTVHPIINKQLPTNVFEITQQGLRNTSLNNDPGDNLKAEIEKTANSLRQASHLLLHLDLPVRDDLYTAIDTFTTSERLSLLEQYADLWPSYADTGGPVVPGGYFTWRQPGLGNYTSVNISIDTNAETISIETIARAPHSYLIAIYIAVWVRTEKGEVLHCQELRGDALPQAVNVTLPFQKGYTVSVLHLEPTRSELINTDTQVQFAVKQIHTVRAMGDGKLQL